MPDSERERRLEELHSAALQRDASERDEFLRQACGDDAELRRAVESLLGYEQELDGFLEVPALQTATLDAIVQERPLVGQMLGLYRLVQPIGSGGMRVKGVSGVSDRQSAGGAVAPPGARRGFGWPGG